MAVRVQLTRRVLAAPVLALALPAAAFAQCPTADQVGRTIQEVFKRPIEVRKVSPSPMKGLCEIEVSFQGRPNILYSDATGAHFVTGHLIDTSDGRDLTEESLSALNKISPEDLKRLDALVAMTLGTKGKPVYFVTDPQ